jgi:type I restriction enzyme S subunit
LRTETDELPEGWTEAPLVELLSSLESGTRPKGGVRKIPSGVPSIGGEHLDDCGGFRFAKLKYVPTAFYRGMTRGHIQKRDVLVVKDGATTGKVSLVREDFPYDSAVVNEHVYVCRPARGIEPEFLFRFLFSAEGQERVLEHFRGAAQGGITQEFAEGTLVRIAPLAEQRRIVAKVEELLAEVNQVREGLARVPAILKRFRQSVLSAACSGRLTKDWRGRRGNSESACDLLLGSRSGDGNVHVRRAVPERVKVPDDLPVDSLPETWAVESVAALLRCGVLADVKDGNHGAVHPKLGEFTSDGLPFITAAQVANYAIDYAGAAKVAGAVLGRLRVGFAQVNDAILTHKGSVGRAALNTQACVLTPQTTYYRCQTDILDPRYLVYYFTSPPFYGQLSAVMSQTTRDFVPISGQYSLFVFLPPPKEQREIVRRVEELFKLADDVEKQVEAATKRVDKLTQTVLAKAFRGELVPTDAELARREGRSYEPASVLLDRIRQERKQLDTLKAPRSPTPRRRKS